MTLLMVIGKVLAFVLLCLLSAFTLLYGRNGSGIKRHYLFTGLVLLGVLLL